MFQIILFLLWIKYLLFIKDVFSVIKTITDIDEIVNYGFYTVDV